MFKARILLPQIYCDLLHNNCADLNNCIAWATILLGIKGQSVIMCLKYILSAVILQSSLSLCIYKVCATFDTSSFSFPCLYCIAVWPCTVAPCWTKSLLVSLVRDQLNNKLNTAILRHEWDIDSYRKSLVDTCKYTPYMFSVRIFFAANHSIFLLLFFCLTVSLIHNKRCQVTTRGVEAVLWGLIDIAIMIVEFRVRKDHPSLL